MMVADSCFLDQGGILAPLQCRAILEEIIQSEKKDVLETEKLLELGD